MLLLCTCPFVIPFLISQMSKNMSSTKTEVMCMYHCIVIWDLESSAHHLQIRQKGSILHNYLHFATLILLAIIFPCTQSVLTSAKKARLQELVGEVEEDEPVGEAGVGPSREATTHSSGSTPLFFFIFFLDFAQKYYLKLLFFFNLSFSSLPFSLLTDDSAEEGASRLLIKDKRDIDTLWSWVQVGGFPA